MDIRLWAIMCILSLPLQFHGGFFLIHVKMNNKMKSDPANKMSDQVHLKTNQRVIFTGVYRRSPAINQSQPSHEPPVSALLAYASIKKVGFYAWSFF